jgi:hypothetical protein
VTKINFSTNVPIALHLHAIEGKERESQFGGKQHMFTADEGVFYVSEPVGLILTAQMRKLDVKPGDPVEIMKAEVDAGRGRKSIQWQVAVPLADDAAPEPPAQIAAPRPVAVPARTAAQAAPERPRWAETLTIHTNALIDVYATVLRHANEQQAGIRPGDVRALLTTMFIQYAQKGGLNSNA